MDSPGILPSPPVLQEGHPAGAHDEEGPPRGAAPPEPSTLRRGQGAVAVPPTFIACRASTIFWADSSMSMTRLSILDTK